MSGRLAVRLLPLGLSVASCHRLRLAVWLYDYCRWGCLSLAVWLYDYCRWGCLSLAVWLYDYCRWGCLSLAVWLYDYCRWGCLSLPATDYVWPFGCTTAAGGVVCRFLPLIMSGHLAVRLLPVGLSVASCH